MVFYLLPKRMRRQADDGNHAASLDNLADSLLLQIFGHLDILSILRVRLTCCNLIPSCNTILQKQLKILYIHPRSIQRAIQICEHPLFSEQVEEVVLLGRPMWAELDRAYPDYRKERRTVQRQDSRFRAWPANTPDVITSLIDGLIRLPNLSRLSFAEIAHLPGLNQSSDNTIQAHARKCASDVNFGKMQRHTDVEIICQLLRNSKLRFNSVRLDVELPFVNEMCISGYTESFNQPLTSLCKLMSLQITLDCGWDGWTGSTELYRGLIRYSARTLEHLAIDFKPNRAMRRPKPESRLWYLLNDMKLERLRSFTVKLLDDPKSTCGANKGRNPRPACQQFEIASFLAEHSTKLTEITIDNVVFCCDSRSAIDCILAVLIQLNESMELSKISWTAKSYKHDERCKRNDSEPLVCNNYACGFYQRDGAASIVVGDFEQLARDVGVELDSETQAWDFGKAVTILS